MSNNAMQIRIAHQLAILISSCVVLAILAVGSMTVWNLRSGFQDYLRVRDKDQLNRLVNRVEQRAATEPSLDWLRNNRDVMRELSDGFNPLDPQPMVHIPSSLPPPPSLDGPGTPPMYIPASSDSVRSITPRVFISDPQGLRLAGLDKAPNNVLASREIWLNNIHICTVVLAGESQPEGLDAHFLHRQYEGLLVAALVTMLVAIGAAWWFAGRWSRPLRELQTATRRIANGELDVHIPERTETGLHRSGAIEIDQLIGNVNAMAAALSALEAARRRWIAEISHELRTPLAVLRGELEAIEDGARKPTPQVLSSLREEVMQLTRLVDDLHTLAIADLGKMPCDYQQGMVNDALQRIGKRFATRAQQLGLTLQIDASDSHATALWDFGRIEQMISNILENSLRYTESPGQIHMQWRCTENHVSIQIADSAPGVPPEYWQRLFEPLFRIDASRARTGQHGSGLGLSVVQAIVQAHSGQVTVDASPLGGLMMRIELPLDPSSSE